MINVAIGQKTWGSSCAEYNGQRDLKSFFSTYDSINSNTNDEYYHFLGTNNTSIRLDHYLCSYTEME